MRKQSTYAPESFWARVTKSEGCWPCKGSRTQFGHVHFRWQGRHEYGHRLAWTLTYGPIPDGMAVCHRCDNPPCARPDHLFLGSRRENMHDMIAKGRARHEGFIGVNHPRARMTEDDVRAIREATGISRRVLAAQYGVTPENISAIVLRKTWAHI